MEMMDDNSKISNDLLDIVVYNLPKGEYVVKFFLVKVNGDETLEELRQKFQLVYWDVIDELHCKPEDWNDENWAYMFLQSLFESVETNDYLVKHPSKIER